MLLLDEPFGALDAKVRAELRRWLRRLHDEQGVTTVLVTHDQEEAMEVADRIAVMNEGQLEQVGPPREVYDHPANQFVMGFLGPVSKLGDRLVRPHDVAISLISADGATEAMVSRVVHLGFEVRVELDLPDGTSARAQLTRAQTAELELGARRHRLRAHAGDKRCVGHAARWRRPVRIGAARRGRAAAVERSRQRVTSAAGQRVTQASGSSASLSMAVGSLPLATSATVTCSTTLRRLARTAIHTRGSASDDPG